MDRLDAVAAAAVPLLRRVDDLLAAGGAPPGHPVWTQLRRVRLLSADAVGAVVALRPAELADPVVRLGADADACAATAAALPPPAGWTGPAADAYALARWRAADGLGRDGLAGRLADAAELGGALAGWMRRCRDALAATLAEVLSSTEAVQVTGGTGPADRDTTLAAAAIAARVLATVADGCDAGDDLLHRTRPQAADHPA